MNIENELQILEDHQAEIDKHIKFLESIVLRTNEEIKRLKRQKSRKKRHIV